MLADRTRGASTILDLPSRPHRPSVLSCYPRKSSTKLPTSSPRPHPSPPHRQFAPGTLHNVSRRLPPSAAALDLRRPPRGHPQCLDHLRSCRRREGEGFRGFVQGVRGPHPRHLFRERCCEQGRKRRHQRCVQGWRPDRQHDQPCARSVRESRAASWAEGDIRCTEGGALAQEPSDELNCAVRIFHDSV